MVVSLCIIFSLSHCSSVKQANDYVVDTNAAEEISYYGTLHPFASEAVYFLMTDRFVDGDSSNNQLQQGGDNHTFDRPLFAKKTSMEKGQFANVGYMGGDFQGILEQADYIYNMGFTAIWLSPVVDNPDEAFAGGEVIEFGGAFRDGGKTGYHGYWGVNFFKIDEHWPSRNLSFKQLTEQLRNKHGIKTVLDIVANHGSPSFAMQPFDQPMFGEIYDADGELLADHQNLVPNALDDSNPLHQFYNHKTEIVQLSDMNENNPEVMEYFVNAYLYWIDQGADAFRVDTLKHMPHSFWKKFSDKIRIEHPDYFMFGESYSYDEKFIAEHTLPENGDISVLDFPGQKSITTVFENPESDYKAIKNYLFLDNSPYKNIYELMTFYDNHDMQRMNASDTGFIDAHNWLFTSRGIPVVYYGSEIAFMAGTKEHMGNRNYFGATNIELAKQHSIQHALTEVANIRRNNISLQKGLQVNLDFNEQHAAFYRIYEHQGEYQTALVLLNKGEQPYKFSISKYLSAGKWINAINDKEIIISDGQKMVAQVMAHSVTVFLLNQKNTNAEFIQKLNTK